MTGRALGVESDEIGLSTVLTPTGWEIVSRLLCHSVPWPPRWQSRVTPTAITSLLGMLCVRTSEARYVKRLPELSRRQMCGPVQPREGSHSGTQVRSQTLG